MRRPTPLFLSILLLLTALMNLLQAEIKPIKVIVFDFGSVIAKTDKEQVSQFVSQSLDLSQEETEEAFNQLKQHASEGKDDHSFWITYTKNKGIKLPYHWLNKLDEEKLQALKVIPGMIELVKDLQKQGYQTALLSNSRQSQTAIKSKLGLYDLFNPVQFSYEIGIKKPNPKAYQIFLNKLKVPADAVLFIDNRQVNVDGAKELGIDGIVFTSPNQLIHELNKRGIMIKPDQ